MVPQCFEKNCGVTRSGGVNVKKYLHAIYP